MPVITGDYIGQPLLDKKGKIEEFVYRPYAEIRINFKNGWISKPFLVLLDTGADRNLFPAVIGEKLGIEIKKGRKYTTYGVGKQPLTTFRHKAMQIFIGDYSFDTSIEFSYDADFPLVGGVGFFDKFKRVSFYKNKELIELEY